MRVAFALLVDYAVHNVMRKLALAANRTYGTGFVAAQLPPHVSLKQPFPVQDLDAVEAYFDDFAASIPPFDLTLTQLDVQVGAGPTGKSVVLWIDVRETPLLRGLHNRLNEELAQRFAHTAAPFDGTGYRFHATIALSAQSPDVYRRMARDYSRRRIDLTYTVRDIALFDYDDDAIAPGTYITYKILPIGTITS